MSIDWERGGFVEEFEVVDDKLNGAGGNVGINEFLGTLAELTGGAKDELVTDGFGESESLLGVGGDDELDETGMVTQIDKNESTVVATRIDPTGDHDGLADVVGGLIS